MNQPSLFIFISCVSPEFRQTRSKVANILTGLGYTPVFQEIFGTESGDLCQVLRDKIDVCAGLIQIVGQWLRGGATHRRCRLLVAFLIHSSMAIAALSIKLVQVGDAAQR